MNEPKQTTSRRTLLQRGLLCVAGTFGLQLVPRETRATDPPPVARRGQTFTLYSTGLQARSPGQEPGKLPTPNGRVNRRAELLERRGGRKVGEFAATGFGPDNAASSGIAGFHVELQTLHLKEGTLYGIGSGAFQREGQQVHALVGGTGRFAGAQGSYLIRPCSGPGKETAMEFVITLLS
jgi:hypothetical protein